MRRFEGAFAHGQRQALSVIAARCQLPQRGSRWHVGPLSAGRLRSDRAQKGGPRLRGQRLLDKSTLSSCCESRPQGTTVSGESKLCSSRVGLTDTPVPLPLGEVSPQVTERVCNQTVAFFTLFSKIKGKLKKVLLKKWRICVTLHPSCNGFFGDSGVFAPAERL